MYVYDNGNEYTGAIQWINGLPYDAMGQELTYTETASSGLEAGNESGAMQAQAQADWEGEEMSWHNILLGVDKEQLQPNLRDEGTGFFKSLQIAFSNLGTDFVVETDYIVQAAESPIDTGEAILKVVAGYLQKALPKDWDKYLPDDWQENKVYANAINAYYADKYGDGGRIDKEKLLDSIAEQPVSVMLDFYAIKAIATAVANKAAQTAQVTGKSKDIAIANELATYERTVIDKGGLVWHEGMGAWVDSSLIPKLAQQVDDIAIGADRSGMLTFQHRNKAEIGAAAMYEYPIMNAAQRAAHEARIVARENARKPAVDASFERVSGETGVFNTTVDDIVPSAESIAAVDAYNVYEPLKNVPKEEMIVLTDAIKTAKADARVVKEQWMDIVDDAGEGAAELFHHSDVVPAMNKVHDANIAHFEAQKLNRTDRPDLIAEIDKAIEAEKIHQLKNVEDISYAEAAELRKLTDDTAPARTSDEIFQSIIEEGSGARIIDPVMKAQLEGETIARINNGDFAMDARLVVGDAANRAAVFDNHIEAVNAVLRTESFNPETLARAERGLEIWTTASNNLKKAAAVEAEATRYSLARKEAGDMYPEPVTAINLAGNRAADGSLKVATQADNTKLARMEKQLDDDAKLAAATQAELFSTANAAAYENYQNLVNLSRIANEAKVTNLKEGGMLDTVKPVSREVAGRETYIKPVSVPQPVSVPRISKEVAGRETYIKPVSVPKARIATESRLGSRKPPSIPRAVAQVVQRISAASQDTQETLPDIPTLPDKGPVLTPDKPKSPYQDMPPYEKSIQDIKPATTESIRPGWKLPHQFDREPMVEGNYWSADFEDEYWNTPAGVNESYGIWGRPVGSRSREYWR